MWRHWDNVDIFKKYHDKLSKFPAIITIQFVTVSNLVVVQLAESGLTVSLDASSTMEVEFRTDRKVYWRGDGLQPFQKITLAQVNWSEFSSIQWAEYSYDQLQCYYNASTRYIPCPPCYSIVSVPITKFKPQCADENAIFYETGTLGFGVCKIDCALPATAKTTNSVAVA